MKAIKEARRLSEKLADGSLDPDEPLFVLRGRDKLAPIVIRLWIRLARFAGVPLAKLDAAEDAAREMHFWPSKTPGLPEGFSPPGMDDRRLGKHASLMDRLIIFENASRRCAALVNELYPAGSEVRVRLDCGKEVRGTVEGPGASANLILCKLENGAVSERRLENVWPFSLANQEA